MFSQLEHKKAKKRLSEANSGVWGFPPESQTKEVYVLGKSITLTYSLRFSLSLLGAPGLAFARACFRVRIFEPGEAP
jgi:hypothetical protein